MDSHKNTFTLNPIHVPSVSVSEESSCVLMVWIKIGGIVQQIVKYKMQSVGKPDEQRTKLHGN